MKFSLILATKGRRTEVEKFLAHLDAQIFRDFELIVVDQNPEGFLGPSLARYKDKFPIVHLYSQPGLSRARNIGLASMQGEVVAFPDDDCWYPNDLLDKVARVIDERADFHGLSGISLSGSGTPSALRWSTDAGLIDFFNVWRCGISYTLFLKRSLAEVVGFFDEELGVGSGTPWGSGEETDYLIRALKTGAIMKFDPSIVVFHPDPALKDIGELARRGAAYGRGMGRVVRKHRYPLRFVATMVLRPIGGLVVSALRFRFGTVRFQWAVFQGRLRGWVARI